jgi:hypothetical protein
MKLEQIPNIQLLLSKIRDFSDSAISDAAHIYLQIFIDNLEIEVYSVDIVYEIIKEAVILVKKLKTEYIFPKYYDPENKNSIKFIAKDFMQNYDKNAWGGLVYEITLNLPKTFYDINNYYIIGKFLGDTYYGASGRKVNVRLIEHILEAVRENPKNLRNYSSGKKYNKLNLAIIYALRYIGYSKNDLKLLRQNIQEKNLTDRIILVRDIAEELITKSRVMQIRIIELTEIIEYAFELEQFYAIRGATPLTGLNSVIPSGVAPTNTHSLPYYDIALMVALGFDLKKIHEVIQQVTNKKISFRSFRTHFQRVFGSYYSAQEALLKPVIDSLLNNDYEYLKGSQVYHIFRDVMNQKEKGGLLTWFRNWSAGGILLQKDFKNISKCKDYQTFNKHTQNNDIKHYYQRFYGVPWKDWVSWAIKGFNRNKIAVKLKISGTLVMTTYNRFGGYRTVQKEGRREIAMELLKERVDPKYIIYDVFGYTKKSINWIKKFYEDLFDNQLSFEEIINKNWNSHNIGWCRFFNI